MWTIALHSIAIEYLGNRWRLGSKGPPIGNGLLEMEWSLDVTVMTLKGQVRLKPNISKTAGDAI